MSNRKITVYPAAQEVTLTGRDVRVARMAVILTAVMLACGVSAADPLKPIEGTKGKSKEGGNEVRVVVPGRMKIVVCDGSTMKGSPQDTGVTGFYDLANDPDEKYNYSAPWSGFFSHKLGVAPRRDGKTGAFMPGPGPVEVIESSPVRAVIKYSWNGTAYGHAHMPKNPDVRFEQIFTVCAPDRLYQTFRIIGTGEEVALTHFAFLLHTSHAKWSGGKTGKGGVYSLGAPWKLAGGDTANPTSILHVVKPGPFSHAGGTTSTHKANFLLVMHKAAPARYGYRENRWIGFRSSLKVPIDDPVITKEKTLTWNAVVHMNHEMTDLEKAKPRVDEYRDPGKPECRKGTVVGDGFDEGKGCYTLKASAAGVGVDFTMPRACRWPVFQVSDWRGDKPTSVTVGGVHKETAAGQIIAHASGGTLLVQIAEDVPAGARVIISVND